MCCARGRRWRCRCAAVRAVHAVHAVHAFPASWMLQGVQGAALHCPSLLFPPGLVCLPALAWRIYPACHACFICCACCACPACCACCEQVELSQYQYLVPPHLRESKPSYFIVGGLVFTACSGGARASLQWLLRFCRKGAGHPLPRGRATECCAFAERGGQAPLCPGESWRWLAACCPCC